MRDDDSLDKSEEGNKRWLSWGSFGTIKMGVLTEEAEEWTWCQKAFKLKTAAYNYWNMSVMQSAFAAMCSLFKWYLYFVLGWRTFNAALAPAAFMLHMSTETHFMQGVFTVISIFGFEIMWSYHMIFIRCRAFYFLTSLTSFCVY